MTTAYEIGLLVQAVLRDAGFQPGTTTVGGYLAGEDTRFSGALASVTHVPTNDPAAIQAYYAALRADPRLKGLSIEIVNGSQVLIGR